MTDDAVMTRTAKTLIAQIEAEARKRGGYSEYKYMNYADGYQDVIDGYGLANNAVLQAASQKYDPTGVL